ncbi:membrane transporter, mitochondrial carrier family [Scheffersomyces xylosifermentans]|uniref:membrane transporter, mitochondrial carrier family n=1 Tax=Scheffersomyces xylosifermentans TaxID=1304137 RepID=UPI00315CF89C
MSMSSELAAAIEEDDLRFGTARESVATAFKTAKKSAQNDENISISQRMISACSGSLITSLVVTPFDVIRIRIQQQQILPLNNPCCEVHFPESFPDTPRNTLAKAGTVSVTPSNAEASTTELFWLTKNYCKSADNCSRITSTFQGFQAVSRNEGIATLWRGLSLTLFMAIPSNIIYFTGYEYIRDHSPIGNHPLNPLLCGAFARIMAATFVAPAELIKTRLQSIPSDSKSSSKMLSTLLKDSFSVVRQNGIGTLFTGLQITLWRDVPFSGIYWSSYELLKDNISRALHADFNSSKPHQSDEWKVFATSFLSGSISGCIAAFFTNPFDVGKTRMQITSSISKGKKIKEPSMFNFLINIYKKEGVGALYAGFGPRVMKVAPSCAIMISSYEVGKKFFKNGNSKESLN